MLKHHDEPLGKLLGKTYYSEAGQPSRAWRKVLMRVVPTRGWTHIYSREAPLLEAESSRARWKVLVRDGRKSCERTPFRETSQWQKVLV
jgi:hypothetical protein